MLNALLEKIRNRGDAPEVEERLVPLAAATLLIEVAWADHDIADEELRIVQQALANQFDLTEPEITELIEESRNAHEESVGLYAFTRTLVDAWDEPQRYELVVLLWRLAFADQRLDRFEEHMIRKIAELLYVSHARFIEAKRAARTSLGITASRL
jgi:uncharacterized tellurite resistance protein B-like protein